MALLEVRDVRAGYGLGPDILTGVSLTIEAGTSYCIIGPNGAGKSTLLKVIAGLLKPRAGTVAHHGTRLDTMRADQILAAGVCFVPQDQALFPEMTVRENLTMGAYLERDRSVIRDRMERAFELFPILRDRVAQDAGKLSGGQQKMLALGRALMIDPEVLMLDEPSLGLAPTIANQIFDSIDDLKTLGITVILVEQNAERGLRSADWGFVLDLGILRFEAPADRILADPRIRELYLGHAVDGEEVT
jgi:branched-chain amino acid transport system ATP-binding protein